jgi:hypothetical protein
MVSFDAHGIIIMPNNSAIFWQIVQSYVLIRFPKHGTMS